MKALLIISLAVSLAVSARVCAAGPADDNKALQGVWKPVKAELAGQPMPDAIIKAITLKLEKGDYEVTVEGQGADKGTWSADASAKPKSMKIVGVQGPNAGKTFPAIYELSSDTLKICYDLSGEKLPAEFKTASGTKLYLVTYQRGK